MSIFFGSFSSGQGIPQDHEPIVQQVRRHIREGEYSQAEEILLDQKNRYHSVPSLPGEWGGTVKEVFREFYTVVCYCFGDLYRAQKQWAKAVQYYQEGLELFKQCELVEGFENDSEDLKKETVDARKNMKECSDRVGKK
ncbi:hypothetical protein IW261DRAFT_1564960 [Armillaria novae-zelandiae]|uniref:Tetratricopeptide repeat protein n=1 Tax=Armillaria novae-zelandiae TaxID=153914 RepID=A0AA39P787_9AGAR|nr:hypothetical protein IW261DRAFT_1564960 [Armillaria novae-zelandiae]